ncbi:hypothetical protein K7432_016571, partial [Basidiobolus ranarum]
MSGNLVQIVPQFSSSRSSVCSTSETESELSSHEKPTLKKPSEKMLSKDSYKQEKLKPEISHKKVVSNNSKTLHFQPKYTFRSLHLFKTKKPSTPTLTRSDSTSSQIESEHTTHIETDTWKKSGWGVLHDLFDSAHTQSKKLISPEPAISSIPEAKKDPKKFRSPFRRRSYTLDSSYKPFTVEEIQAKSSQNRDSPSDEFATRRTVSLGSDIPSNSISIPSISISDTVEAVVPDITDNNHFLFDDQDAYDYNDGLLDRSSSYRVHSRNNLSGVKTIDRSKSMELIRVDPGESTETLPISSDITSKSTPKPATTNEKELKRSHSLNGKLNKPLDWTLRKNSSSVDLAAMNSWAQTEHADQDHRPRISASKTFTASKLMNIDVRPVFNEGRFYVVDEILTTELNYLENLEIILNTFMIPIQKSAQTPHPIISPRDTKIIFEGIEPLYELSLELCQELKAIVNHWDKGAQVGDLFLKRQKEWEIYPRFVDNYSFAREAIRRAEATHSFNNFIKNVARKATKRQTLKEFLIIPIQRVTRYSLLLKDLKKQTKPDHPDYREVERALEFMTALAVRVNEVKQREEERTQLFTVFNAVRDCPPTMISANRRFTLETDVVETRTSRKIHLVLYSDYLMFTTPSKGRPLKQTEKWVFIRLIDLRHIIMFNVP